MASELVDPRIVKLIVFRAGDAAAPVAVRRGEFFSWIRREAEPVYNGDWDEHDIRVMDVPLPAHDAADGFIITGSSSNVTERAPWMLRVEEWLRAAVEKETPVLGICFGHQLVGEALGGKVTKNPRGREIGTVTVRRLAEDSILDGLPATFTANCTHVESVVTLPTGAKLVAETDLEPNAVFTVGRAMKCVQFHPEIDGDAMRGYVEARAHLVNAEGLDAEAIRARSVDTPYGAETLRNFIRHVVHAP